MARLAGFEPATYGLEVRCSIQLSYKRIKRVSENWSGKRDSNPRPTAWKAVALPTELFPHLADPDLACWSGRKDSNLRPPAPKAGALTRLRYAPNHTKPSENPLNLVELGGIEPPASSVRRKRAPAALQPLSPVTATILEMERIVVKTNSPPGDDSLGRDTFLSFPAAGFRMFKAVRGIFIFLGKENSVLSTQPEIFEQLVSSLHELFKGKQCIRSECGFSWVALFFRGYEKPLFLCWRDPFSGLCLATEENVTGLVITENGTPPFSEALRKYMVRSSLVRINRIGGDRVIAMEYSRKIGPGISRKSSLVCEFAGKRSGIFIIDESGKIIESSRKHREQADPSPEGRPGCLYSPPTAFQGYSLASQDGPDLFYCLESITGIGKRLGSQLVKNWHLFPRKDWSYMISRVIKRDMPPINRPGLRLQIIGKDISIFPVLLGNNPSLGGDIADVLADTTILPLSRDRLRNFKNRLLKDEIGRAHV